MAEQRDAARGSGIVWMTYSPTLTVHAIYPGVVFDYDFYAQQQKEVREAVCGHHFYPPKLVADEGGSACSRCIKVALAQNLSLPSRGVS